jgi:hypothetical protein
MTWRRRSVAYIAGGLVVVTVATAALLFRFRARPVLFCWSEAGDPIGEPAECYFNPFRDRQAERAAAQFLEALKRGDHERSFGVLAGWTAEDVSYHAAREHAHPLSSWSLVARDDRPDHVRFFFRVQRQGYRGESPAWLNLTLRGDAWSIDGFETWY